MDRPLTGAPVGCSMVSTIQDHIPDAEKGTILAVESLLAQWPGEIPSVGFFAWGGIDFAAHIGYRISHPDGPKLGPLVILLFTRGLLRISRRSVSTRDIMYSM
jgi:hypothetical protein